MIFKEWFDMFYNAYCVDVIAYDCYKDFLSYRFPFL